MHSVSVGINYSMNIKYSANCFDLLILPFLYAQTSTWYLLASLYLHKYLVLRYFFILEWQSFYAISCNI